VPVWEQTSISYMSTGLLRATGLQHPELFSAAALFANAKSAEFLAAASTPVSIPRLQGLPEVRLVRAHFKVDLYNF
jgi:hypothetical protein